MDPSIFCTTILSILVLHKTVKTSSGTASLPSPNIAAVASFSRVALLSGVPSCVGLSARTMSKVFSCPGTGVSITRPG